MTSSLTGIENGRAAFAYQCALKGKNECVKPSEYKSYAKRIPMLIKTNGLGATLAFMLSKGDTYGIIGEHIFNWLNVDSKGFLELKENDETDFKKPTNFKSFTEYVVNRKSQNYRMLTIEVLSLFNWLRRFAEGLIEGEANGD